MLFAVYLAAIYLAKIWVGAFLGRALLKPAGGHKARLAAEFTAGPVDPHHGWVRPMPWRPRPLGCDLSRFGSICLAALPGFTTDNSGLRTVCAERLVNTKQGSRELLRRTVSQSATVRSPVSHRQATAKSPHHTRWERVLIAAWTNSWLIPFRTGRDRSDGS